MKWLPKLLGYDYEILYKKGNENVVADALSRVNQSGELLQMAVSHVASDVWEKVKESWNRKIVVGGNEEIRKELIKHFHNEAIGGHSGVHVTTKKISAVFYWKGLKKMVKQWIRECDITMDFIEKLPMSHGKSVILVVVDRLSKYAHFMALSHPFSASQVAQLSTTYHPQTDGQTEVVNSCVLPNTPIYIPYVPGDCKVETVDRTLQAREEMVNLLKFHLKRSQDRMKNQANKHRTDRQFEVGDWVYLKLQPHRQVSIRQGHQHKLSPKYYGPFRIEERIGEVAYKLQLPDHSQIHSVFHISQHKKCHGKDHHMGILPQLREDGLLEYKPMAILERSLGKQNNRPVMFVLTQWTNRPIEEATWEIYADLIARFPGFDSAP
ncbi:retrotransposable element Tf2 [Tanacetum coccineum]